MIQYNHLDRDRMRNRTAEDESRAREGDDQGLEGVKANDGGAPTAGFRLSGPEGFDQRTLLEKGVDDISLNPFPLSVNDPYLPESLFLTFKEVIFQKGRDLFW